MPAASRTRRETRTDSHKAAARERSRRRPSPKTTNSPGEHADRNGQTLSTRSHEVIQEWAEERNATPATVPSTRHDSRAGVLRFLFGNSEEGRLRKISWDDWFRSFDTRHLNFLYQERLRNGNQSNFFRLENPDREDA